MKSKSLTRRRFMRDTTVALSSLTAAQILTHAHAAEPPAARKLGFAFVGLGRFATRQLMPAVEHCQHVRIAALVTGTPEKAKKFGEQYGVPEKSIYNYETFDRIKDNQGVDVVYVVLPNSMHAEYTIRAADAGKHVLCEKPMAINADECRQMIDACEKNKRKLMIGYRLRYEPHHMKAIEICHQKTYGPVRIIEANHSFNIGPGEWRADKALAGGGPIMDLGIYCLNAARYLTGEEPTHVTAQTFHLPDDPRFKNVDASMVF